MDILINGEQIDFTLEAERTLGQIVDGLQSWSRQNRLILTSIKLRDRLLSEEQRDTWESVPLEKIERLEVSAESLKEVHLTNLQTVYSYLTMLQKAVGDREKVRINDLVKEQAFMVQSMGQLLRPLPSSPVSEALVEFRQLLSGATGDVVLNWPEPVVRHAGELLDLLGSEVSKRFEEVSDPLEALGKASGELRNLNEEIGQVSVMLQTGRDRQAMAFIIRLSDISARMIRILAEMQTRRHDMLKAADIGGKPAGEFFDGLNGVLRELLGAFDENDTVLIADLLEYEVGPRLELFGEFLGALKAGES